VITHGTGEAGHVGGDTADVEAGFAGTLAIDFALRLSTMAT